MATVDDLGRAAATKLRADVRVDAEAGLRKLHATAPAPSPDRRRWWAVAGAAAVLVIAVGTFVLIDRSPGQPSPVTDPGTVAPTTVVPSSVAPAPTTVATPSTTPSTLPGSSTSGAPTTTATTTTAAAPSTTVADPATDFAVFAGAATIDLQPQLVPLPLPGCDPSCPSVVSMEDGTIVAWDDGAQALLVLAPGAAAAQTVPVNAPALTVDWVVAVGPDDVAYLFAHPAGGTIEDGLDLVAVPLAGPNAGTVVATAQDVGDMTGDTEWAPTAAGLVAVSCCDAAPVRPSPTRPVSMGWVDSTGRPTVDTAPQLTFEIAGGATYSVRRSDVAAPFDVTEVIDTDVLRGMPLLAASPDGGVIIGTWPLDATTLLVGRARADGTRERFTGPPEGTYVMALDAFGAVVADGTTLARWQFPGYGAATELDAAALVDGASFATADDAVATILDALRADDGCEVAPTAELVGTEPHGAGVVARFTARYGCDDSGAGRALAVALAPGADGRWTAGPALQASLCRRGVFDGLCV